MTVNDAYFAQRLLEQLQTLQQRLSEGVGSAASLTQRCEHLTQKIQKLITTADDNTLQTVFEVTILPNLDALLIDANYQLKLKKYNAHIGSASNKSRTVSSPAALEPPPIPRYLPGPKPEYDDHTKANIEQALHLLKDFLAK